MVRLAERLVRVNLGHGFTFLEQLLQPKQVAVYALPICGPRRILQVTRNRLAEQRCAVLVLA